MCHMSVARDDPTVCVGSLHCANKSAKQFQGDLLEAQLWVKDDTDAADECMSAPEFIKYHQRRRGRKRALTDEQVQDARDLYYKHPAITMAGLARRYRVSPGVISDVIDRTGAYSTKK